MNAVVDLLSEVGMDEDMCRTQLLGMAKVLEGLAGDDRDGAVWLLHVEKLLELISPPEQKLNREMVLEALRSSDHPALSAYARIEALRQP